MLRPFRRLSLLLTFAVVLMSAGTAAAQATDLKVMTRNLYSGTNMRVVYDATTPAELVEATGKAWKRVQATNFGARAKALADEVAAHKPHVLALQEVALWRTQSPGNGPITPATTVAYDFLKMLQTELKARGQNYTVVSTIQTFDAELLAIVNNDVLDVRFTDRNVILMRNTPRIDVIQSKKKRFQNRYVLHTHLTGDIVYNRSWSFVDLRMDGKRVRVINTHLEALDANVRDAQMQELLNGPANVKGRVIMAGDFNFAPNDPTTNSYGNALTSGYRDVWTALKSSPGFTGVQKANLKNAKSQLSARIDYIFAKGKLTPKKVGLVGHLSKHRTPNGLWPSDHAGVVATIRLK